MPTPSGKSEQELHSDNITVIILFGIIATICGIGALAKNGW